MNLLRIMLSEKCQSPKSYKVHDFTYRFFENDKTIEMENKISGFQRLSRAWSGGRKWGI